MSPENTQNLFDAFPYLYRGRNLLPSESTMPRGFECGDGWFDLIWNLSQAIEDEARSRDIEPESENWPEATQVKQKIGALRFHLAKKNDATNALVSEAYFASEKVCELCGAPAARVANTRRYIQTLCTEHAEEFLRNSPPVADPKKLPVWKLLKTETNTGKI